MMTQTPRTPQDIEPMHDGELLQHFCEAGAPWAFDELRRRHLSLVYSTARRALGDSDLAEDVAQVVFLLLIRKARQLRGSRSIAGWLFQTTRLSARNAQQQEARRHKREQEAQQMQHSQVLEQLSEAQMWASIEPHLHEALATLSDKERHAVLLRLFENRSAPEVARLLGISPNAAQMRVARGVEKLRRFLIGRGLPITSATLAAMLSEQAVQAAPLGLFAATSAGNAAAAGVASSGLVQGVMQMMKINAWKKTALRLGVGAVVAGSACGAVALRRGAASPSPRPPLVAKPKPDPTAFPNPNSPVVGNWKRTRYLRFALRPDGTGEEFVGLKPHPLVWTEQDGTITFTLRAEMGVVAVLIGRLSPDKRTLTVTETHSATFPAETSIPLNRVYTKQ